MVNGYKPTTLQEAVEIKSRTNAIPYAGGTDLMVKNIPDAVYLFVNDIEHQTGFDRVLRYKGRFLKVYNYPKQQDDKMAALHAKVISTDKREALITSANLSYHGQEGNLELGTYIESPVIAQQIDDVFTQLIFKKVFVEV